MDFLQVIILGIVEGVTEFLPVSSTFHLIFSAQLMGIQQSEFMKLFEVVIQSGAIVSVVFLYGRELIRDKELLNKVIVSFLPTALVGFALYKVIKTIFFESQYLMIGVFSIMGLLFILFEYLIKKDRISLKKETKDLTVQDALLIGFVQSLAVIPGVSRAGSVLLGMMLLRYKRDEAARYSFILSIPTIFVASAYDLYKMRQTLTESVNNGGLLIIGFLTAMTVSFFVMKWFIAYLKENSLAVFGYYRILLAIILLLTLR